MELVYQARADPADPARHPGRAQSRGRHHASARGPAGRLASRRSRPTANNEITVGLPDVHDVARAERRWADRRAVLLRLGGQRADAQRQDRGQPAPGPGPERAGDQPGRRAGDRASRERAGSRSTRRSSWPPAAGAPSAKTQSRKGPQYYMFGAPGSPACAAAAKANGTTVVAGPALPASGPRHTSVQELQQALPTGVTDAEGQLLTVPQGTVVLQAANQTAADHVNPDSPNAQFFVLKDNVSLRATTSPARRRAPTAAARPDVHFGFSSKGQNEFQTSPARSPGAARTSAWAVDLRPALRGRAGQSAVTVPSIDFRSTRTGSSATTAPTSPAASPATSATDLATQLRLGALPVTCGGSPRSRCRPRSATRRCIRA